MALANRSWKRALLVPALALPVTALAAEDPRVVAITAAMPDGTGLDVLRWLEESGRREKAIVITAYGSAENAVEALKAGYDEAIMLAPNGLIAECTGENIFVSRGGRLITPPLSANPNWSTTSTA